MKVFRGLDGARPGRAALSIGNFDGVHGGHRAIIGRLVERARASGAAPTAVTFEPHPQFVLRGESPLALTPFERKAELLEAAGVEQLVVLAFDRALAGVEPEDFIERIVAGMLAATAVVVGTNFRFGRLARGDLTMLETLGAQFGFAVEAAPTAVLEGRSISSTEIRHALAEGDLAWANRALGRPHRITGRVERGEGRGRSLGFPTANVAHPPGLCMPAPGIYAGWAHTGAGRFPAAVSLGTNPTFGGQRLSLEAHLLDFDADLYGQGMSVDFVARLRDEAAFAGAEELARAIRSDVEAARALLGAPPEPFHGAE